ncbi:hypothetical protein AOLI_G00147910 [Acnodon oligacanthus]
MCFCLPFSPVMCFSSLCICCFSSSPAPCFVTPPLIRSTCFPSVPHYTCFIFKHCVTPCICRSLFVCAECLSCMFAVFSVFSLSSVHHVCISFYPCWPSEPGLL